MTTRMPFWRMLPGLMGGPLVGSGWTAPYRGRLLSAKGHTHDGGDEVLPEWDGADGANADQTKSFHNDS